MGLLLSQKGLDSPLYHLKLTRHKICAKNLGWTRCTCKKVIQKQVIEKYRVSALVKKWNSPCVYLTLMRHPIFTKKVIWMAGLAVLTKKNWFISFMFDSYTSCNFNKQRKKTDHRGEWAPCAHKKCCVHLIYVCLSHVMQYSKKIHVIGACGHAAFEKIIRFISFTFDCHPLCNFRKKQVIGEGWPDVLAKKQFEFISLHLTLRHHAIFTKKS